MVLTVTKAPGLSKSKIKTRLFSCPRCQNAKSASHSREEHRPRELIWMRSKTARGCEARPALHKLPQTEQLLNGMSRVGREKRVRDNSKVKLVWKNTEFYRVKQILLLWDFSAPCWCALHISKKEIKHTALSECLTFFFVSFSFLLGWQSLGHIQEILIQVDQAVNVNVQVCTWTVVEESRWHRNGEGMPRSQSHYIKSLSLSPLASSALKERWCLLVKCLGMIGQETVNKSQLLPSLQSRWSNKPPLLLTKFEVVFCNCTSVWPKRSILKRTNKTLTGNTSRNHNVSFLIGPFSAYTFSMAANCL